MNTPIHVSVVGSGVADPGRDALAERVGAELARLGAVLVCGGLGGVMAAACRGARAEGGRTVGLLPGDDARRGNAWLDVRIVTGMSEGRNALVARSGDALVALPGEHGTLSEIALALKMGRPVIALASWREVAGVEVVDDAEAAARRAVDAAGGAS